MKNALRQGVAAVVLSGLAAMASPVGATDGARETAQATIDLESTLIEYVPSCASVLVLQGRWSEADATKSGMDLLLATRLSREDGDRYLTVMVRHGGFGEKESVQTVTCNQALKALEGYLTEHPAAAELSDPIIRSGMDPARW